MANRFFEAAVVSVAIVATLAAQNDRARTEALARRAGDRLQALHREAGELERFDRVIANPPFSQNYTKSNMEFPERFRWGTMTSFTSAFFARAPPEAPSKAASPCEVMT